MTTHLHITSWAVAIILFVVALILIKNGKAKPAKIVQMILRVFYLLVIASGIQLFLAVDPSMGYHIKLLFGILVIAMLEMVLVRTVKGKSTVVFWTLLIIFFAITIYLGLSLPLGWWTFR
ncbi:YisL family protein [Caldibacillus lycopersici]|uniref:UPF0344 protein OEV98_02685 n=1 Tax=Perspicuibacillus lycopersici TaxID=1325689 RepID=A0AAE3IS78_9BACI|nr:YisL family protein [Perspicuibacillus lycopersici]MCU9612469.1 YisL family protein [Perspicuibacillus lycopersici]